MKTLGGIVAIAIVVVAVGCGGNQPAPAEESSPQAEVTFRSEPDPPRMGENSFEVTVMQGGQPITDADVSIAFFMPAMPSMNMAEMRNTITLTHQANGMYRATGNVMMAGNWEATVLAMRGGQEIASRKFTVTAK